MAIATGQFTIVDINDITVSSSPPSNPRVDDLWLDTSSIPYTLKAWNGSDWINSRALSLAELDPIKDAKLTTRIKTFYQDDIPTSTTIGDFWVDTDDNNHLYRAEIEGANEIAPGEWVSVRDTYSISLANQALQNAATAQETADGQIQVYYQTSAPTEHTVFLCHANDLTTEEFGHTLTISGGVNIFTNIKKFGIGAFGFGNGGGITVTKSSPWTWGSGEEFTIDMWVNLNSSANPYFIIGQGDSVNNQWYLGLDSTKRLIFKFVKNSVTIAEFRSSGTIPFSKIRHIAFVRYGSNVYFFINGIKQVTETITPISDSFFISSTTYISNNPIGMLSPFLGVMDEIRISNIARWTDSFTLAESAYTPDLNYGDIWIDTTGDSPDTSDIYRYEDDMRGSSGALAWRKNPTNGIGVAYLQAYNANKNANTKITTFYQDDIPTSNAEGDLWIDTNDNNHLYRASSAGSNEVKAGEWVSVRDADAISKSNIYNDVEINESVGVKATHANGGYTQLKGDGLKRYIPIPQYISSPTGIPTIEYFAGSGIPTGWEYSNSSISTTIYRTAANSLLVGNGGSVEGYARCYKEITADVGSTVSFYYRCWGNDGQARFYVDGVVPTGVTITRSGSDPGTWTQVTVSVTKGIHTFQWDVTDIGGGKYIYLYIDEIIFEQNPVSYSISGYSNTGYSYNFRNYINDATTVGTYGNDPADSSDGNFISPIWIQLPEDFKGQNFKVFLSVKDSTTQESWAITKIVLKVLEIDTINGRFKVQAYCKGAFYYYNTYIGSTTYNRLYWGFGFTYFATY